MAWTIVETPAETYKIKGVTGDVLIEVKLTCTSDAGASDYDIESKEIRNSWLYMVKIIPGTGADAPAAAFDLDIEDESDAHVLDTDANSDTATTFHSGAKTLGLYPPIKNVCSMVCATLGNGNKATIYLYFTK